MESDTVEKSKVLELPTVAIPRASREDGVRVAAAKKGDRQAFGELFERHRERIFGLVASMTRSDADAEDIVQQSFQKAYVHLRQFRGESSFSTWLTRIAVNEVHMLWRTRRRHSSGGVQEQSMDGEDGLATDIADFAPGPEELYFGRERREILGAAIKQLAPETRAVLHLTVFYELTTKQAAQILGVSLAAAKSRVLRGRLKLLKIIAPDFQDEGWNAKRNLPVGSHTYFRSSQSNER